MTFCATRGGSTYYLTKRGKNDQKRNRRRRWALGYHKLWKSITSHVLPIDNEHQMCIQWLPKCHWRTIKAQFIAKMATTWDCPTRLLSLTFVFKPKASFEIRLVILSKWTDSVRPSLFTTCMLILDIFSGSVRCWDGKKRKLLWICVRYFCVDGGLWVPKFRSESRDRGQKLFRLSSNRFAPPLRCKFFLDKKNRAAMLHHVDLVLVPT